MAELADAADLKSVDFGRVGSSPTTPTIDCARLAPDGCGSLLHGASERASPGSRDALAVRSQRAQKHPSVERFSISPSSFALRGKMFAARGSPRRFVSASEKTNPHLRVHLYAHKRCNRMQRAVKTLPRGLACAIDAAHFVHGGWVLRNGGRRGIPALSRKRCRLPLSWSRCPRVSPCRAIVSPVHNLSCMRVVHVERLVRLRRVCSPSYPMG